jgi:hypothetical protein
MVFPANLTDAISAARDGELGDIEEIKIGDLVVSALTGLQSPRFARVTRKPVETGFEIADAIVFESRELSLDICLANPDFSVEAGIGAALSGSLEQFSETWRDKKAKLEEIYDTKQIVTVQTHDEILDNMVIEMIDPYYDVEDNSDAYFANVVMVQIKYGSTQASTGIVDAIEDNLGGL